CAQYGGQTNQASIYCSGPQYNAQLCAQYSGQVQQNTAASTMQIQLASTSVTCGGTMAIAINVAAANGQRVADGTVVALSATAGQLTAASHTTLNGTLSATYTAPATATTASLNATSGAATD